LSVYASGNANVRYRLILSSGDAATNGLVQSLPLDGSLTLSNQALAGGDWRYYRVQVPTNGPNNLVINWSRTKGSAHLFVRDTVPPGDNAYTYNYNSNPSLAITWASDYENEGPYPDFPLPGTYTLTTPPVRPGTAYYFGFWSPDDTIFSINCSANGGTIDVTNLIAFNCASRATNVIAGNGILRYRLDVPPDASSLTLTADNSTNLVLTLEQGTLALPLGPAQWTSQGQANASLLQSFISPDTWPWLPGYSYYLTITNTSPNAENLTLAIDGHASASLSVVLHGSYARDGSFHLLVGGQAGNDYIVQASTDLVGWTSLSTNCGSFEYMDSSASSHPVRFYRTLLEQ
jgi:hypothetical protein